MKVLKIGFFVPFYPTILGGAEFQAKIIATELQKRGHQIFYISTGHSINAIRIHEGIKVYELSVDSSLYDKLTLYAALMKKVAQLIKAEKPDLIYQRILNTFTYRLSKITYSYGIPFILHIADNYCLDFSGPKGIVKKYLFKQIYATRPYIICQTHFQDQLIAGLGMHTACIIPNMHPELADNLHTKNKNQILWIGNVRPVKQLEVFLELADKFSGSDLLFKVIGSLPKNEYGKTISAKMDRLKNVEYLGSKTNSEINNLLGRSALLVNTSTSEGFSNTFIQAWMSGTPVLALNSDPDLVMQQYGIGVNCEGDKGKLPNALNLIIGSSQYEETCFKARQVANTLFSTRKNMVIFERVLDSIVHDET